MQCALLMIMQCDFINNGNNQSAESIDGELVLLKVYAINRLDCMPGLLRPLD